MESCSDRAIAAAYTQHGPRLVRHLTTMTRDPALAEDLAQDAFVRLARELEAGRTPDSVGAWLHRVATNLAISHGRRAQVAHRQASALVRPPEPRSPESIVAGGELAAQVGALVETLSETERHAVLLAAHGVTGIEIARSVGRTPAATRTLLCRARAKLRLGMQRAGYALA